VYVPDLMQETTMRHQYSEARSLMLAPIFARGQIRGVVEVGYNRSNSYTEADMLVFQQMVSQLNVAIENAEAFVQTQKSADNKALANQISTHLQRQNRIEDMLNVTVTELGKALGAKKARVRLSKDDKPKFDAMPERNPPPAAPEQN
jgi:GAF domain-containing protein